ncbi:Pentatricopeptide repeat-containing protein At4g16390, chloroplastic [Linum grandiflorum]
MAYSLCASPSLYRTLCNSLSSTSSSRDQKPKPFKLPAFSSPQSKPSLHFASRVSLQDSVSLKEDDTIGDPNGKPPSPAKSFVWVNPKSARAAELRVESHDTRYATLVKAAQALDSCSPDDAQVRSVLNGLGHQLSEQGSVVVINNMTNSDTALLALRYFVDNLKCKRPEILYNVTMKIFRNSRRMSDAEKLFDEMLQRGVAPDNVTFSTIISCAKVSAMPDKIVEWFERMSSFRVTPDEHTICTMIDAYGRAGEIDKAFDLYDRARTEKWKLNAGTFATVIKIYGMSGNYDGCLNVYEEMKALGVKPNVHTINALLDAMGRAKRPWTVKTIYKDMIHNGITPTFLTLASLLRGYGRARYSEDALAVYREMKGKGMTLNVVLYNTLVSMCADLGLVDEATEIFEDMRSSGVEPDDWTFSSMITAFSSVGRLAELENILNAMEETGIELNLYMLTSITQCYGRAQRSADVVRIVNRLFELGISPDDRYCGCLLGLVVQTPKEELSGLVECIERGNPKLGSVVKHLVQEQHGNEEVDFKEQVAELFDSIDAGVKKVYCNGLIDLCVKFNLHERAHQLLDLGIKLELFHELQWRSPIQWSLQLKGLSLGAGMTALDVWINDLSKAMKSGEQLPPLLGISTGHGKHSNSDKHKGLATLLESHLKELKAPFHDDPDKSGWFLTTKVAAEAWLEAMATAEV